MSPLLYISLPVLFRLLNCKLQFTKSGVFEDPFGSIEPPGEYFNLIVCNYLNQYFRLWIASGTGFALSPLAEPSSHPEEGQLEANVNLDLQKDLSVTETRQRAADHYPEIGGRVSLALMRSAAERVATVTEVSIEETLLELTRPALPFPSSRESRCG